MISPAESRSDEEGSTTTECSHPRRRERINGTFAASPILNQNRIFITAENGSTTVLSASPKFEILAENPLDLPVQASPAIYKNSFLIRSSSHLTRIGGD